MNSNDTQFIVYALQQIVFDREETKHEIEQLKDEFTSDTATDCPDADYESGKLYGKIEILERNLRDLENQVESYAGLTSVHANWELTNALIKSAAELTVLEHQTYSYKETDKSDEAKNIMKQCDDIAKINRQNRAALIKEMAASEEK